MFRAAVVIVLSSIACSAVFAQTQPPSDPQALSYAAQSIAAMVGGVTISDVTLSGTVTWNGSDTGTATLRALGTGESRMDLSLSSGTRTEIRDAQTGSQQRVSGSTQTVHQGKIAFQNCQVDAVWFFPVLGSLATGPNVILSYIGPETRNGESVQHIQSYVYQANPTAVAPSQQLLGTLVNGTVLSAPGFPDLVGETGTARHPIVIDPATLNGFPNIAVQVNQQGLISHAFGAFQFMPGTWTQYGGGSDISASAQDDVAATALQSLGAVGAAMSGNFQDAMWDANTTWASLPDSPYGQPTMSMDQAFSIYQNAMTELPECQTQTGQWSYRNQEGSLVGNGWCSRAAKPTN